MKRLTALSGAASRRAMTWLAGITLVVLAAQWISVLDRVNQEKTLARASEITLTDQLALGYEQHVRRVLERLEHAMLESLDPASLRAPTQGTAADVTAAHVDVRGTITGNRQDTADSVLRSIAERRQETGDTHLRIHASHLDPASGKPVSLASLGVRTRDGQWTATLVSRVPPDTFLRFFQAAALDPGDVVLVVGFDGQLRARRAGPVDQHTGDLARHPLMREAIRAPSGGSLTASPVDGKARFYSWRSLPEYQLIALVGASHADLLSRLQERIRRIVLMALLLSVLILAAAGVVGGVLLRQHQTARRLRASEQRQRDMLRMAADWYWETDADHRLISLRRSERCAVLYPPLPRGALLWEASDAAASRTSTQAIKHAMERLQPFDDLAAERRDSQGRARVCLISACPVFDHDRRFTGYRGVGQDVTHRFESRRALEASELRLASIVETAMDAVVIADADMRIVVFNAAAARMFRYCPEQALGKSVDTLLPARFRAAHGGQMRHFSSVRRSPRTMGQGSHVWALRADGEEFPVDASISHVDVGGEPLYAVVMRDITSRLANERALLESADEQARLADQLRQSQKMESLGAIAGGIAHDFNNVVAAIQGNAQLAERCAIGPEAAAYLREISRASLRARELVRRIMSFSRREQAVLVRQRIGPLVSEAVGLLEATLPSGVRLTLEGADGPWEVVVDGNQIHQVIMNLGTNAWQALKSRNGSIVIGVACHAHEDCVRLTVSDDGEGIDEQTASRMFEPFFTTKPQGQGTGLGLAVVQDIVRSHQGEISVKSRPAQGCTVEIRLPLARADLSGVDIESAAADERFAPAALGADRKAPHIVYIDDYDAMVMMVTAALQAHGYRVTPFACALDALAYLRDTATDVDLVVTDYDMPDLSGIELTRALRATGKTLPIVIASGYLPPEVRDAADEAGATELFDKPAGMDGLLECLARHLPA